MVFAATKPARTAALRAARSSPALRPGRAPPCAPGPIRRTRAHRIRAFRNPVEATVSATGRAPAERWRPWERAAAISRAEGEPRRSFRATRPVIVSQTRSSAVGERAEVAEAARAAPLERAVAVAEARPVAPARV